MNLFSCRAPIVALLLAVLATAGGCTAGGRQGAAKGAAVGAAAGAVGGLLTAAIFGGDVGTAVGRGAAWGAGTGAVTGAVQGDQADAARERAREADDAAARQAELDQLQAEIGTDAYAGLVALTDCKHEVAHAWAKTAATSRNRDHALAGAWLGALTYADERRSAEARAVFPDLIERDDALESNDDAGRMLQDLLTGLQEIRAEYGLPATCAA